MESGGKLAESVVFQPAQLAAKCLHDCDVISGMTEREGAITRRFLTPPIKQTHDYLLERMQALGLSVRVDDAGNLIGRRAGSSGEKTLLLGSHLDTVPNGGKYDGLLGVTIGLAVLELIEGADLPMNIDLIGFSEEEGVRFSQPYLGSSAIAGRFKSAWLDRVDGEGNSMRAVIEGFGLRPDRICEAAYDDNEVIGFIETHIEQGPLLHQVNRPVGVIRSIAGQSRLRVRFTGLQGHAGTAPMNLRHDALVAASRWITDVSRVGRSVEGLRATVGCINALPNIRNVIPDRVELSLDVRHFDDQVLENAVAELCQLGSETTKTDEIQFEIVEQQSQPAVEMDADLCDSLRASLASCGIDAFDMFSGAGHDAAVMAEKFPTTMLFIRQASGISHHPDEDVDEQDVAVAIKVLADFIGRLASQLNDRITVTKDPS